MQMFEFELLTKVDRLRVRGDLPGLYALTLGHGFPNVYFNKTMKPRFCSSTLLELDAKKPPLELAQRRLLTHYALAAPTPPPRLL